MRGDEVSELDLGQAGALSQGEQVRSAPRAERRLLRPRPLQRFSPLSGRALNGYFVGLPGQRITSWPESPTPVTPDFDRIAHGSMRSLTGNPAASKRRPDFVQLSTLELWELKGGDGRADLQLLRYIIGLNLFADQN
ncbi:MAG: hypothetical protein AAFZ18_22490 [Myxococcota bacterium]